MWADEFGGGSFRVRGRRGESIMKSMVWKQNLLRFWPFWGGYISVYHIDKVEEMYAWLEESCPKRFYFVAEKLFSTEYVWTKIKNKNDIKYGLGRLFHIYFRNGRNTPLFMWTKIKNKNDIDIDIKHGLGRLLHIYFRKESDAVLFMLTFKGDI